MKEVKNTEKEIFSYWNSTRNYIIEKKKDEGNSFFSSVEI